MVDDLFLIIVIDQEEGIFVILVDDIYQSIDDIAEYDFISAVMQKLCNKTTSDFACAEMYCFFHPFPPVCSFF